MHGDFIVVGNTHTEVFCFAVTGEHIFNLKWCVFLRLLVIQFNGRCFLYFGGRALRRDGRERRGGGAIRCFRIRAVRLLGVAAVGRLAIAAVGLGRVLIRCNQIIRHGHGGRGGVCYFVVYKRSAEGGKAYAEQNSQHDNDDFYFLFLLHSAFTPFVKNA